MSLNHPQPINVESHFVFFVNLIWLVMFRYVTDNCGVRPHPYMHYSLPRDVIDLATGEDPAKLIDFLKLKQRTEEGSDDSDDN